MRAILATIPTPRTWRGASRARPRPCCSVPPGLVRLDWDAANHWKPRPVRTARLRLAQERLVRLTASAPMSPVVWRSIGASVGHERRFVAAEVRADSGVEFLLGGGGGAGTGLQPSLVLGRSCRRCAPGGCAGRACVERRRRRAQSPARCRGGGRTPAYTAIVIAASAVVRTPHVLWSGFIRERRWGFSTQRLRSLAADRPRAVAVNSVLTAAALPGRARRCAAGLVAGAGSVGVCAGGAAAFVPGRGVQKLCRRRRLQSAISSTRIDRVSPVARGSGCLDWLCAPGV
jgi:hypothetical protein